MHLEVTEALDLFGDPGGHERHHGLLVGRLLAGSLSVGDVLTLRAKNGGTLSARIGGFHRFRDPRVTTVNILDAATIGPDPIGVMLRFPPILARLIAVPYAASLGTPEELQATLRDALTFDRRPLFLHLAGSTGRPCKPCLRWLLQNPELEPGVAVDDPRAEVADAARVALELRRTEAD